MEDESKFKVIGFTLPDSEPGISIEADAITTLLSSGAVDLFHLRKPLSTHDYVICLIDLIPSELHNQLVLHSHYELYNKYDFAGIHLCQHSAHLFRHKRFISRSCHSLKEITEDAPEELAYQFLSPIFDSISKEGYMSNFSLSDPELKAINSQQSVIALGGVKPDFFCDLYHVKFAGAALLGYLWNSKAKLAAVREELIAARKNLD